MPVIRRGHTLLELLVALSVGVVVIGLAATIAFRHQRFHRDVVIAVERSDQLAELIALLPIPLRGISPGEGDIAPGGARDTAIEFRGTIASAVVCDSASTTVMIAPLDASPRLASALTRPEAGDTAWFLDPSGATETWAARAITVVSDSLALCRVGLSAPFGTSPRTSLAMRLATPAPVAAPIVRVTRPWRYSVYRASDARWYLGAKEWNPAVSHFNTIQPVAGPIVSPAGGGMRFRYLDSLGSALPAIPPDPRRIAAIEISLRVDSAIAGQYAHAASIRSRATVVISLRNRQR